MKKINKVYLSAPVVAILLCSMLSTITVLAVTFWSGTQLTTVDFGNGGVATYKDIALPTAFISTPTDHIEICALNITTLTDPQIMTLTQSTTQRANLVSQFAVFQLVVKDHTTSTVAFTWNLLIDLSASLDLLTVGDYEYDYEYSYTSLMSSGSYALEWDLSLMSV